MKKLLVGTVLTLALTTGAFAQRGVRTPGSRPGGPAPFANLKNALNLTDAQVSAIQSSAQAAQQQSKSINTDLRTRRQALEALLSAGSANPSDVGNAALAVRASENQLKVVQSNLMTSIRNTLTSDQQQTFDSMLKAGLRIPGIGFPGMGPRGMRGPGA
jgi:Spy/CpxP family protein refolding chaperone